MWEYDSLRWLLLLCVGAGGEEGSCSQSAVLELWSPALPGHWTLWLHSVQSWWSSSQHHPAQGTRGPQLARPANTSNTTCSSEKLGLAAIQQPSCYVTFTRAGWLDSGQYFLHYHPSQLLHLLLIDMKSSVSTSQLLFLQWSLEWIWIWSWCCLWWYLYL